MLTFIDVKFIFDSVQLRKYSLNSRCRPPALSSYGFCYVLSYYFAQFQL